MKVKLTIERTSGAYGKIVKYREVSIIGTDSEIKKNAELQYLNEYINRDCQVGIFTNLSQAKKVAKIKINSEPIK